MLRALCTLLALVCVLVFAPVAHAHGMRTAYVELHERLAAPEGSRVFVSALVRTGASYGTVHVVMPAGCTPLEKAHGAEADASQRTETTYACESSLAGTSVRVDGLGPIVGDAVVTATLANGAAVSGLVRVGATSLSIPSHETKMTETLGRYVRAGFVHVASGADHLLFLAALVIALRRLRAVIVAETAFTISHSLAFSAAALGWIHVPPAVAEAAIALSLVLVALDLGRRTMTSSAGARAALVFGAVHGLGFAGGLEELGVPRQAVLPALTGFALGVELAQVAFLFACFALLAGARRLRGADRPIRALTGYAVGVTGMFWLFERSVAVVAP